MKHLKSIGLVLPILLLLFTACNDKGKTGKGGEAPLSNGVTSDNFVVDPGQGTPIQFSHLTMQFGPVTSGDTVRAAYPFKNMTNTAVTITGAITSCPCMMTDFPKTPIQPGALGEIKVNFATAGQMGRHEKIIAVTLQGTNEPITLHLNGQIDK
jgi:hypothetical protein